ncbi:MAG TPA: phosphotransferase [Sphingomicrobium sp.]|nr:phosphotransferase [Sphingomicrobium sp.]
MPVSMIPPEHAPAFLAANGWAGARIEPLAGDASFRRYFRVIDDAAARQAVLMDAPPQHEDIRPFLAIADHLIAHGLRAPRPLARDLDAGLLLLEDFGDRRVNPLLADDASRERQIYEQAIDTLVELHRRPLPPVPPYNEAALIREARLFPEWYAPAAGLAVDEEGFDRAWRSAWGGALSRSEADPVLVLRDYHADNLMVLDDGGLGLLDFQDALAGHRAYDLVSLLQDARREVSVELESAMIERYLDRAGIEDRAQFLADYAVIGAQRHAKVLGIFTRLWKRDGKPHYLAFQPRNWALIERCLAHPALRQVRAWFDSNVPPSARSGAFRDIA